MTSADLLREWTMTRRGAETWLAQFEEDPGRAVRACCMALARPQSPDEVVEALVAAGEYEGAELLTADDIFYAEVGAEQLATFESRVACARAAACEELTGSLGHLMERAGGLGLAVDARGIRAATERRLADGMRRLAEVERAVHEAEHGRILDDPRLAGDPWSASTTEQEVEEWRASVHEALRIGAYEAAAMELEQGPGADRRRTIDIQAAPRWPFRGEPIAEIVRWCLGEGLRPPGFERFIPITSDFAAWGLLRALHGWCTDSPEEAAPALLQAFAAMMGCSGGRVASDEQGALIHLDDLSAPCFYAFGRRQWPLGLPVHVVSGSAFAVRAGSQTLYLPFGDIVAIIHDEAHRRSRLLAQLGRQLTLTTAFPSPLADESVRWEGQAVPAGLLRTDKPVLLVGAPGAGKTTLLRALAASVPGAVLLTAGEAHELPDAPVIIVDAAEQLDMNGVKALRGELYHVREAREPAPAIVVAGRPELLVKIRGVAPKLFALHVLPARTLAVIREHARLTLGWVGIEAAAPGLHDRMASLVGDNPELLIHLCQAVADAIAARGGSDRRMDAELLSSAWQAAAFRRAARALLWDPLQAEEGARELLIAVAELTTPGESLGLGDLLWAVRVPGSGRDEAWVRERSQLLTHYGLLSVADESVRLPAGGIARLVREWAVSDDA